MNVFLFFASLTETVSQMTKGNAHQRFSTRDILVIITAAVVIGLLLVAWVAIARRGNKERDKRARSFGHGSSSSRRTSDDEDKGDRRRRRRRRKAHRPRNPSLQETGGLPPQRPEDQPPKH